MIEVTIRPIDGNEVDELAALLRRLVSYRESLVNNATEFVPASEALGLAPTEPSSGETPGQQEPLDDLSFRKEITEGGFDVTVVREVLAKFGVERIPGIAPEARRVFLAELHIAQQQATKGEK